MVGWGLNVVIPANRHDDMYYNVCYPVQLASGFCDLGGIYLLMRRDEQVNVNFNGQTLSVLLDTESADTFVASTNCNATDPNSGCYLARQYDFSVSTLNHSGSPRK